MKTTETTILVNKQGTHFHKGEEVLVRHLNNRPFIAKIHEMDDSGNVKVEAPAINATVDVESLEKI